MIGDVPSMARPLPRWLDLLDAPDGGKPVLVAQRGPLNYGRLAQLARGAAAGFRARGWDSGTRVLLATSDDRHLLPLVIGCLVSGVVPVLADPEAPAPAAQQLAAIGAVTAAVVDRTLADAWGLSGLGIDVWSLAEEPKAQSGTLYARLLNRKAAGGGGFLAELEAIPSGAPEPRVSPQAPACIFFTSGSTATPKAVEISHGALATHLATLVRQLGYGPGTRLLNLLPWHHADGLIQGPLAAIFAGATLHRPFRFAMTHIQRLIDAIYGDRITAFVAVPTMLSAILRMADGLKDAFTDCEIGFVTSTAGHLEVGLWQDFEARFGISLVNVYGLTETVAGSLFSGPDAATRRVGSLGKPVDCQAKVIGEGGEELAVGETGEICLAGPHLMTGYFGDAQATEAVMRGGWLHTGDLGRRDTDGFFHFAGRRKNVLVSGGHTISPEEITAALRTHPDVADAVTTGLPHPDLEEIAVSAVVAAPGAAIDEAVLADYCRSRLSDYKVPRRIVFLPSLPYGPSGKVRLEALRAMLEREPDDTPAGDVAAQVLEIARQCFRSRRPLSPETSSEATPGWDSMGHLEFICALEDRFSIGLSSRDIMRITTLALAIETVEATLPHG
jgi:acyl-CoA synthetase (AMP-forming)/AMP-acid ligase II/acyl carrier protein